MLDSGFKDIMLVNFVSKDDMNGKLNPIGYGAPHFYLNDDETEDEFSDTARAELRKSQQSEPNNILLVLAKDQPRLS